MIYDETALWGLTENSSQEEIWEIIFKHLREQGGRASIATVKDGKPDSRIISLQRMSDGYIYFMTSKGKPFYRQLKETPYIAASSLIEDTHRSIRLRARAEECTEEAVYKEYAEKNPGTMKMYRYTGKYFIFTETTWLNDCVLLSAEIKRTSCLIIFPASAAAAEYVLPHVRKRPYIWTATENIT